MRALEIQKIVRMVLDVRGEEVRRPNVGASKRSRTAGSEEGGRILLTMRAIWRRMARRIEGISSASARRMSSLRWIMPVSSEI